MAKIIKSIVISIVGNMCFAFLAYIFQNKEIWGTVFLVLLCVGIISGTFILIRIYTIEMMNKKIDKLHNILINTRNKDIDTSNLLLNSSIESLRKLRNQDWIYYNDELDKIKEMINLISDKKKK